MQWKLMGKAAGLAVGEFILLQILQFFSFWGLLMLRPEYKLLPDQLLLDLMLLTLLFWYLNVAVLKLIWLNGVSWLPDSPALRWGFRILFLGVPIFLYMSFRHMTGLFFIHLVTISAICWLEILECRQAKAAPAKPRKN